MAGLRKVFSRERCKPWSVMHALSGEVYLASPQRQLCQMTICELMKFGRTRSPPASCRVCGPASERVLWSWRHAASELILDCGTRPSCLHMITAYRSVTQRDVVKVN